MLPVSTVSIILLQFLIIPMEYCQIISHSVTYGQSVQEGSAKEATVLPVSAKTASIASEQDYNIYCILNKSHFNIANYYNASTDVYMYTII